MGETRANRPRRRLGGLIVVVVVAVAAVSLVLWVVLRDNKSELLAPPVNTTPQLGPEALAVKFNAAVAVTVAAEDAFLKSQADASAACSCAAGEQDPQTFAHDAQALLPSLQEQERMLTDMVPAAAADIAEHLQAVIDANRQIQTDIAQMQEHSGDADTGQLNKARLDLQKRLTARAEAIQVVEVDLGIQPQSQPTD
ncbi:MAG: hypothetical protein ACXWCM_17375 [Acidimicrobiales bacterium]